MRTVALISLWFIFQQVGLVLEAMNNLIVEVFDVYSRICNGIAQALLKIYASPAKSEASMALRVVQKAATQVEDLSQYLEVCREMGVLNASQCPKLENIPKEDVKELEQIINGSANNNNNTNGKRENCEHFEEEKIHEEIIMSGIRKKGSNNKRVLKTVITDKWEIFDGDCSSRTTLQDQHHFPNCYSSHLSVVSLPNHKQDLPDLITF